MLADQDAVREEQLQAEQLIRQLKVSDLLIGTLASLVQLGYAKLGEGEVDEARLAIDALRALVPVLEGAAAEDAIRDRTPMMMFDRGARLLDERRVAHT